MSPGLMLILLVVLNTPVYAGLAILVFGNLRSFFAAIRDAVIDAAWVGFPLAHFKVLVWFMGCVAALFGEVTLLAKI
jgi:hypothetical protein